MQSISEFLLQRVTWRSYKKTWLILIDWNNIFKPSVMGTTLGGKSKNKLFNKGGIKLSQPAGKGIQTTLSWDTVH